jgi:hypothetical protein
MKFAAYLPEFGWEASVVAPRNIPHPEDRTLCVGPVGRVIRTPNLVVRRGAKTGNGCAGVDAAGSFPGLRVLRAVLLGSVLRPDAQVGWYPFAVAAARRALNAAQFDAVFSSSPPLTTHLVARRLHRDTGLPWVAEFRDVWTGWGSALPGRRHSEAFERGIACEATAIVTASPTFSEIMTACGAQRVQTITNGFDPSDFGPAAAAQPTLVTYLGTYYPDCQDLETAFLALGALSRAGRLPGLRVRFVGGVPAALVASAARAGIGDVLESTDFVPHRACLAALQESGLLLLAGPLPSPHPARRGHIPGKVFEYLGAGRPILAVGSRDSDVIRLLTAFPNVRAAEPGDVIAAEDGIEHLLSGVPPPPASELEPFTRRELTGRLAEVLDDVTGSRASLA